MNEIQSVLEVSNLTEKSITDTSEQPNGIQLNVEDENKATEKSSNDNGDKTEPDVLPNKDEQSIALGSEISAPGKSFSHEKDGKASGSSDPPKDLDDDLKMNEIQSVLEVSNLTETSITDTSEQPNGIQLNVEDENKATEKSSNDNGDKTEPDVLPNKDEQSIALGSEISAPGKSFSHEKDGKASGSSDPPKDLDDDLKMNEIQSVLEVSNLTETSITDTSEQPNGIQLNLEDENKATEKSSNDNGDKTEPDVLPNKDEQSIVLGSEISEPGKSFSHEKDGKASGSSDPPKDLDDDLQMNEIQCVSEVSNLTEKSITDTLEQPNGIQLNVEDENKAIEKSINYNGDKTEPDALPNKDVQSIVLGSEFSEPGSSYWKEKDGKVLGSSTPPKDLDDNMKSNEIQSVMEVSNLTDGSITDIVDNLQDDDNGSAVILDKSSKSVQYRPDQKGSTLLVSNQLFGTHNFHNVTTVITNKKTNKLPIPKIKHNEIVSAIQKSRFMPRPVAELQLKSFKNLTDKGTWYEINNDFEVNPSSAYADAQTGVLNNTKEVTIKDLGKESSYFMSTETTETDVTKVKRAISYFISFDKSDNENRKYKVPKKLLFKTNAHVQINKQIPLDDSSRSNSLGPHLIINEDKDTEIPTADPDYQQQPGVSKLQTILELNENDLITDNRVTKLKLGKTDIVGTKEYDLMNDDNIYGGPLARS
ncbi:uncharacterized protein LOC121404270 isoform X6 [Drosophila obscura]|uniref:uncharacterized protein LOC121404270 isoform X6 n=1 Tax=Drosophila obscura TaxID=7282 RepID=UPI001BB25EF7|nr:uncharacterized protein LOC121404270 isoform X6 [Drosophila obscura]